LYIKVNINTLSVRQCVLIDTKLAGFKMFCTVI
jgi:hypothetical protein